MKEYLIGAALGAALLVGTWYHGYEAGKSACEDAVKDTTQQEKDRQDAGADRLKDVEVVYRDRIKEVVKVIREAPDPSGCKDTDMPGAVIEQLGGVRENGVRPGSAGPAAHSGDPKPAP